MLEQIEFFKVESGGAEGSAFGDGDDSQQFDFNKLILFCLLFCEENPKDKVTSLFYLMCDENEMISHRNGQVKTIVAMLTIISCMIPAEMIKIAKLSHVNFEDQQEFDQLYTNYCTQPQTFNKFTTYLKNAKLFGVARGPLSLANFRQLMQEQDHILVDSALIRYEYTYFVCFQMTSDHDRYFNRPSI